jgi:ribosome-binding factor A
MSLRIQKVNELLKQEIGGLILKELDFSRDTMVTITEVSTSPDLQQAKVKVSIMPFLKAEKILKILNSQVFNLQKLLNKKLKMKTIPKIRFELDKSEERKTRIEQLFRKIK